MKNLKFTAVGLLIMALAVACVPDQRGPIEKDKAAPGVIKDVSVEEFPGGAKISYSLPSDLDLLYVVAEYSNKNHRKFEFKSSYYTNFLVMNGFSDSSQYEVKMYAVDRSGNRSASTLVSVTPKTPPVLSSFKSLEVKADFGGIRVSFKNPSKADLVIVVNTPDTLGVMVNATTYYTAMEKGSFTIRGYKPEPRKFQIYIRDRWDNTSDILEIELTPVNEIRLDKKKFKELFLPGDSRGTTYGGSLPRIWDESTKREAGNYYHTGNSPSLEPQSFTFDLGVVAKLSRFTLQAQAHDIFNDVVPKIYEIYGANELDISGSFSTWTKLLEVVSVKPSGLPRGQLTNEDKEAGKRGDERSFPPDIPTVRYIRLRCIENWTGSTNINITEMTFWGAID